MHYICTMIVPTVYVHSVTLEITLMFCYFYIFVMIMSCILCQIFIFYSLDFCQFIDRIQDISLMHIYPL